MGGVIQEEQEQSGGQLPFPLGPREPAEFPGWSPEIQSTPPPGRMGPWGHRKEAEGRTGEAGGRGPLGGVGEKWRAIALPTQAWGDR